MPNPELIRYATGHRDAAVFQPYPPSSALFAPTEGGAEGVKLEQRIMVTENGYELLSRFPFENALLA